MLTATAVIAIAINSFTSREARSSLCAALPDWAMASHCFPRLCARTYFISTPQQYENARKRKDIDLLVKVEIDRPSITAAALSVGGDEIR